MVAETTPSPHPFILAATEVESEPKSPQADNESRAVERRRGASTVMKS
jgi:hypothetical protein